MNQIIPIERERTGADSLAARRVYERFVDVPGAQRLLCTGNDAVYRLPEGLHGELVALDVGAMQALLIRRTGEASPASVDELRSLRAQLRTARYGLREAEAPPHVITEIRRNPGQGDRSAGTAAPLAQFQAWIAAAEEMGASDVHIEVRGSVASIRVRVNGVLVPLADRFGGRYARQVAIDAVAAGFNSTRVGNTGPHYEPGAFVNCIVGFDTARCSGQARYQNLPGRLGPKVCIRLLRMRPEADE